MKGHRGSRSMSCKKASSWHSTMLKSSRDYRNKCQGPQRPDVEQNVHLKTDALKDNAHLTILYCSYNYCFRPSIIRISFIHWVLQ